MDKNISKLAALTQAALWMEESLICCILKRLNLNKTRYKDASGWMNLDHDDDDNDDNDNDDNNDDDDNHDNHDNNDDDDDNVNDDDDENNVNDS